MDLIFRTKRLRVAVSTGIEEEDDDFLRIYNTGGDFDEAPDSDDAVELDFGFRSTSG